jgi:hypothetical protein
MKQIIIISILFDGVKSVLYNIELMFGPSSDILMAGESSDEILNAFLAYNSCIIQLYISNIMITKKIVFYTTNNF